MQSDYSISTILYNIYCILNFELQYKHMENAWVATSMIISHISCVGHVKKTVIVLVGHMIAISATLNIGSKFCLLA